MIQNGSLKRLVRARAEKTDESYTAALKHIRQTPNHPDMKSIRVAVAQTSLFSDPGDPSVLHASGKEM